METPECTTLLATIEKQFLAGNITSDDFTTQLQPCLPQACDQVYGTADFDLIGPGLYYSTLIHVTLFILCGPLQALISRCLSPHARTSTTLSLARFQSVLDTAYTTGTLLAFAIFATGFIRSSIYPIAALERSVIRDTTDLHTMLQNLAMASYLIMKTPGNITRGSRAWGFLGVYACTQILNVASWYLTKRIKGTAAMRVIEKLCVKDEGAKTYPSLHLSEAPGWNPLIVGALLGVAFVLLSVAVAVFLPRAWKWVERMFSSAVLGALVAVVWNAACLFCIGLWTYRLTYTRDGLEGLPEWDVGQVFVVAVWVPAMVQMALAVLMTLTPERGGVEGKGRRVAHVASMFVAGLCELILYHPATLHRLTKADVSWFGREPRLVEDQPKEKPTDQDQPRSTTTFTQNVPFEQEKVPLANSSSSLEGEKIARNPSPGTQV